MIHQREAFRPTSTGNLIQRVIPASRQHLWLRDRPVERQEVACDGRELWILHPHGDPMPDAADPSRIQILLLDGSWREASAMAKRASSWGRMVSLPMSGRSRYWLRMQADENRFSTMEALLCLLERFGRTEERDALRLQFELHVYATLRARGAKELALEFLSTSPIREAFADLIAALDVPRPR